MIHQMTAVFLVLHGVRTILLELKEANIIGQTTLDHFDTTVQLLETDCINGGFDISAVNTEMVKAFNPEDVHAKAPYENLE
jgi:hypothetical protein